MGPPVPSIAGPSAYMDRHLIERDFDRLARGTSDGNRTSLSRPMPSAQLRPPRKLLENPKWGRQPALSRPRREKGYLPPPRLDIPAFPEAERIARR